MTELQPEAMLAGRYQLVGQIARGGMASVWVAIDTRLARRVAIKVLDQELARDPDRRDRFRREAVAAAGLSHPGIVATHDTGEDDGQVFIVMELIDGQTLRHVMSQDGPMPVPEVCDIGAQVAAALDSAHRQGLVHRDVKPANILVERDGRVKVTDFGIAKATGDADLTRTGTIMGTARYLAPEQVDGSPVDARADVYALGLVLWEALTGKAAFSGDTEVATAVARLHRDPDPIRVVRPDVPEPVSAAIAAATRRDLASRTRSAADLRDALLPYATDRDAPTGPMTAMVVDVPTAAVTGAATADATQAVPRADATAIYSAPARYSGPPPSRGVAGSIAIAILAFAIGILGGYLVTHQILKDRDRSTTVTTVTTPTAAGVPVPIVRVSTFDPPPGDGHENDNTVGNTIDGNPSTSWTTEHYNQRDFGGIKAGVGLVAELDGRRELGAVRVTSDGEDWSASIYVADRSGTDLAAWGNPVVSESALGRNASFTLPPGTTGKDVLLWITRLPASGQLGIDQLSVVT